MAAGPRRASRSAQVTSRDDTANASASCRDGCRRMVDGKIQAFPWNEWREEFPRASALGLARIEWTIDQDRLARKSAEHRSRAAAKSSSCRAATRSKSASLTGDCFMQAPFWKADGEAQKSLVADLDLVLASCATLGIEFVVIPLVDNGRIESAAADRNPAARSARSRRVAVEARRQDRFRIRPAAGRARAVHRQIPARGLRHQLRHRQQRRARL